MQMCSSDIKFNFLLVANMQNHDYARETDLHLPASPFEMVAQYVLKLSLLSICINFRSRSSNKFGHFFDQGTVQQSESTILLGMRFLLDLAVKCFRERSQILSYCDLPPHFL